MFLDSEVFVFISVPEFIKRRKPSLREPEEIDLTDKSVEHDHSRPGVINNREGDPVHYPGGYLW